MLDSKPNRLTKPSNQTNSLLIKQHFSSRFLIRVRPLLIRFSVRMVEASPQADLSQPSAGRGVTAPMTGRRPQHRTVTQRAKDFQRLVVDKTEKTSLHQKAARQAKSRCEADLGRV